MKKRSESKKCWQWISSSRDTFPVNSFVGGFSQGNKIYVARAAHGRSLTPGRFSSVYRMAFIPYYYSYCPEEGGGEEKGQEIGKISYEILVAPPDSLQWIDYDFQTSGGQIPLKAVLGGYSEPFHETLYIGRWLQSNDNLLIGCIQPSRKTCYVPYDSQVVQVQKNFQILVES